MSMVAVVLVVLSAVIAQSIRGLSQAQSSIRSQTKVTSLVERVASLIDADVAASMRVFGEDAYGRAYLGRLDVASLLRASDRMLLGSRMPVATMRATFTHDAPGVDETGNLLLVARRDGFATVDVSADLSGQLRRVDRFRFVVWFLHSGVVTGVDLGRFSSGAVARLSDVNAVDDAAARARLVKRLLAAGVGHAWDPGATADVAFFVLGADGSISPLPVGGRLPADRSASESGIFATRHVGVAPNGSAAVEVPKFANAKGAFPSGLEIKHDGDGSGDLVLLRLVVATASGRGRTASAAQAMRQVAFRQE